MRRLTAPAKSLPPEATAVDRQRHRIIGVGHGNSTFPFDHLCDQTIFGHAEDMLISLMPPLRDEPAPSY
jgi:hypothetical protein